MNEYDFASVFIEGLSNMEIAVAVIGILSAIALRSFYAAMAAKIYNTLAFFPLMPQYPFMNYVTVAIILSGMLIGAIGSAFSLKRFLEV